MNHVVIFSGGMDSYSLLQHVMRSRAKDERLLVLTFDYGQRHRKEIACAITICDGLDVEHKIVRLGDLMRLIGGSSLTDDEIATPHGHYAAENMKKTVVPARNTIMLSIALAHAERMHAETGDVVGVYYGAHSGDHAIYPDCRLGYVQAMSETMQMSSDHAVLLIAPFVNIDKGDILTQALAAGVDPLEYADTWTCYEGGIEPCRKCGACAERAEAFTKAGALDPLLAAS